MKRFLKPEHPGSILRELYIEPLGVSNVELSKQLGVSRVTVNRLLNAKQGITAEMAVRLSKALNTTTVFWLNLQRNYDIWEVEHNMEINVEAFAL